MRLPLALAGLSASLCCCGDLLRPPAPTPAPTAPTSPTPQPTAPATAGPYVLLATEDHVCDLALLDLATQAERPLGAMSDCPRRLTLPGAPGLVMDERGVRWDLDGQAKAIEPPALPTIPDLQHPDSLDTRYELGPDGVVRARRTWGTGEVHFEEGPSYEGTGSDAWSLVKGAWVAGGEPGPGPATVTLGESGAPTENLEAMPALVDKLGGDEVCGWQQTKESPRVAWPLDCGEAGDNRGPLFVQKDGVWSVISGTEELLPFDVDQSGSWLIVRFASTPGLLIDLSTPKITRHDARMWLWRASWVPQGRQR